MRTHHQYKKIIRINVNVARSNILLNIKKWSKDYLFLLFYSYIKWNHISGYEMKIVEYSFYMESCYIMTCHQTWTKLPGEKVVVATVLSFPNLFSSPKRNWKNQIEIAAIKRVNLRHCNVQELVKATANTSKL